MSGLDRDWYSTNGLRSYPIDDAATCLDDSGTRLPPGILVDCALRFPSDLGVAAFVSGVTVTPTLATIAFEATRGPIRPSRLAGPAPADAFTPLGSVSVPLPAASGVLVPIEPALPGVGGWVVLGPGVARPYRGRFSTPAQSALLARCARGSSALPIRSIAVANDETTLDGVVRLLGDGDVDVYADYRRPPDEDELRLVLVARLRPSESRDVFAQYAGPCGPRPESGSCAPPAVEAVNDAVPDADGDLQIAFVGAGVAEYHLPGAVGGIVLDVPITPDEMCPTGSTDAADPATGLPAQPGYDACGDHIYFGADDPGLTVAAGTFLSTAEGYRAENGSGTSAAYRTRPEPPRLITARFTLADAYGTGGKSNGGVVFGLREGAAPAYYLAVADIAEGSIEILRVAGYASAPVASGAMDAGPKIGPPGRLQRTIGGAAELRVAFAEPGADGRTRVTLEFTSATTVGRLAALLEDADGAYGVGAVGCYTLFQELHAEDVASVN